MKASRTNSSPATIPTNVIRKTVAGILPVKASFKVQVAPSGLGELKIVRVITDAWKRKPVLERLERVITAVRPALTPEQNDAILRFSVLTPREWAAVRSPATRAKARNGSSSRLTVCHDARCCTSGGSDTTKSQ